MVSTELHRLHFSDAHCPPAIAPFCILWLCLEVLAISPVPSELLTHLASCIVLICVFFLCIPGTLIVSDKFGVWDFAHAGRSCGYSQRGHIGPGGVSVPPNKTTGLIEIAKHGSGLARDNVFGFQTRSLAIGCCVWTMAMAPRALPLDHGMDRLRQCSQLMLDSSK